MKIEINCPCGKAIRAPRALAGRRVKCPRCGGVTRLPGVELDPPAKPSPAENPGSVPRPSTPGEVVSLLDPITGAQHPEPETLIAYEQHRLVGWLAHLVGRHIETCPVCRGQLELNRRAVLVPAVLNGVKTTTEFPALPRASPGSATWSEESTILTTLRDTALQQGSMSANRFELGDGGLIGRDELMVRFHLDHPHVSRRHAGLVVDGGQVTLFDLKSSNGTFVNGQRLAQPRVLAFGDRIDIGPFSLRFDGTSLVSQSRSNNIELAAHGLSRVVRDRASGQPLGLLNDIDLVIRPGEFVCLLGPSGSGKTTLLAILSGRNPPSAGSVLVNGEDLYANFEAIKEDIAVVPQKDVLHDSLTVAAALRYTAELRLPPDHLRGEVDTCVAGMLDIVRLTERQNTLIRHLSGGQVKRASLANELVSRPSLLFLDEVTSGLDEQTDQEVMELFREVAEGGKTVVCVTHSLANVESTCHLVVILTQGGHLAFIGTPAEAKAYFGITRLGDVYRKLAAKPAREWSDQYRASHFAKRYVTGRLPTSSMIRYLPTNAVPRSRPVRKSRGFRQAWILTRRYVNIWRGDLQALFVLFGQSLLIAIALGVVFGRLGEETNPIERVQRTVNFLMLLAVASFWLGCNTAAKELVKERIIFLRERDFNLRIGGYFLSKFLVLALVGIFQVTILLGIARFLCEPPGSFLAQWATLAALATAGSSIGLLVSAIARTEEVATALVPVVVLPQIIMAGVVVPLKGLGLWFAKAVITVYWGQFALEHTLPAADLDMIRRQAGSWHTGAWYVLIQALTTAIGTIIALHVTSRKPRR